MSDSILRDFQSTVGEVLIRDANLLDIMSKITDASARANRAVTRSITDCGCISISTLKLEIPKEASYEEIKAFQSEHLIGHLCPNCQEKVIEEIGKLQFYIAALAETLGLSFEEILQTEKGKLNTLGKYMLY